MFLIFISFTMLFIFVQQVELEEKEDRETKYPKMLLEYFIFKY